MRRTYERPSLAKATQLQKIVAVSSPAGGGGRG